jgi:Protein of unknown function (DUF3303)
MKATPRISVCHLLPSSEVAARGASWSMKQYMVIESFLPGCKDRIYERFEEKGRMLPDGLVYVNSWLEKDGARCFQLMETDNPSLFQVWFEHWKCFCTSDFSAV